MIDAATWACLFPEGAPAQINNIAFTSTVSFGEAGGRRVKNPEEPRSEDLTNADGAFGGVYPLRAEAAAAWREMRDAYHAERRPDDLELLRLTSGYHPDARQKELWLAELAKQERQHPGASKAELENLASQWVAQPGGSAHRSGRALDLYLGGVNASYNVKSLRDTEAYQWLYAHACEYGFYLYNDEPWHWEYNPIREDR